MEISRQIEPLLLLVIDELSSELHLFASCPFEVCRERIERLADAGDARPYCETSFQIAATTAARSVVTTTLP
jgi:hypothetical protein